MMNSQEICLSNLHRFTEQEVYNYIKEKLLQQDGPSLDQHGHCSYRGECGRRCAAGHIISDEEYAALDTAWRDVPGEIEGVGWNCLVEEGVVPSVHQDLIARLQVAHDDAGYWNPSDVDNFRESLLNTLSRVAARRGLIP